MTANLTSKNANYFGSQTETVAVLRRHQTGTNAGNEPIFDDSTPTSIYSGLADVQLSKGDVAIVRAGLIAIADAVMMIEPLYGGSVPAIQVGDKVTWNGNGYEVINVMVWPIPYPHTACDLKRGISW